MPGKTCRCGITEPRLHECKNMRWESANPEFIFRKSEIWEWRDTTHAGSMLIIIITPLWRCHGIVIAASSLCQGGRMALPRRCDYIAIVLRLRCNHSTIKTQSHRPDVVIVPPSHMKRRGHLIETAKPSIIDIGTIEPIGTIEFIKIVLKKSRPGCLQASFCFVNTKKVAPQCGRKSMKGHQMHRRNFYFESCVCQKKRKKLRSMGKSSVVDFLLLLFL